MSSAERGADAGGPAVLCIPVGDVAAHTGIRVPRAPSAVGRAPGRPGRSATYMCVLARAHRDLFVTVLSLGVDLRKSISQRRFASDAGRADMMLRLCLAMLLNVREQLLMVRCLQLYRKRVEAYNVVQQCWQCTVHAPALKYTHVRLRSDCKLPAGGFRSKHQTAPVLPASGRRIIAAAGKRHSARQPLLRSYITVLICA